jgi:hypothetical protein
MTYPSSFSSTACSSDSASPTEPGTPEGYLHLSLSSSYGDLGAISVRVSGPGVDSVSTAMRLFATDESNTSFVIVGSPLSGEVARVWIPDVRAASSYAVVISEAAARQSYELIPTSAISASLSP